MIESSNKIPTIAKPKGPPFNNISMIPSYSTSGSAAFWNKKKKLNIYFNLAFLTNNSCNEHTSKGSILKPTNLELLF